MLSGGKSILQDQGDTRGRGMQGSTPVHLTLPSHPPRCFLLPVLLPTPPLSVRFG